MTGAFQSAEIALIYLEKIPGQYLDVDALMGNLKRGSSVGPSVVFSQLLLAQ